MNTVVTSREQLIKAAKEIACTQGIAKINVRSVANACGISVGSIYNYFPTKTDLVVSVVESFWAGALQGIPDTALAAGGFCECFTLIFHALSQHMGDFRDSFLTQLSLLESEGKALGREKEASYFMRIEQILEESLRHDTRIPPRCWAPGFTPEGFAHFAFENMLLLLRAGHGDCQVFLETASRALYLDMQEPAS